MENTLSVSLMIAFLLIGAVGGVVLAPEKTEIEYVDKIEYQEISVIEIEYISISQLDLAVAAFLEAVEDEEDQAGNSVNVLGSYDFDEIEVSKVYNEYSVYYDNDKTTVEFSIKLKFDEDGEPSEKEIFDVEVVFEDNENTEVYVD